MSGRSEIPIIKRDTKIIRAKIINERRINSAVSLFSVLSTESVAVETITVPSPDGNNLATTRLCEV